MAIARRRSSSVEDSREPSPAPRASKLEQLRSGLVIDKDNLDDCLVQQPELYYHVAEAFSHAIATRDALKLDIEIAEAREAKLIRELAAEADEKLTEAGLREQLALIPELQKLRRRRIEEESNISAWQALKEAFTQRSYMLRELVPMHLSRFNSGSVSSPRTQMADAARERAGEERVRRGSFRIG